MRIPPGKPIKIEAETVPDAISEAAEIELTGYMRFVCESGEALHDFYFLMRCGTVIGAYANLGGDERYGEAVRKIDTPQSLRGSCNAQIWSEYVLTIVLDEYPAMKVDELLNDKSLNGEPEIISDVKTDDVPDHDVVDLGPVITIAGIRLPHGTPHLTDVNIAGTDLLRTIDGIHRKRISGYARITFDVGSGIADGCILFSNGVVASALFESRSETTYGDDAILNIHSLFDSKGIIDVKVLPNDTIGGIIECCAPISKPVSELIGNVRAKTLSYKQQAIDQLGTPAGSMTMSMSSQDIYPYTVVTRSIDERKTSGYLWIYNDDACIAILFGRGIAKAAVCYSNEWRFGDEAMNQLHSILACETVIEVYELPADITVTNSAVLIKDNLFEDTPDVLTEGGLSEDMMLAIKWAAGFREKMMEKRGVEV